LTKNSYDVRLINGLPARVCSLSHNSVNKVAMLVRKKFSALRGNRFTPTQYYDVEVHIRGEVLHLVFPGRMPTKTAPKELLEYLSQAAIDELTYLAAFIVYGETCCIASEEKAELLKTAIKTRNPPSICALL
jgi:hypothetical protein